MTVRSRLYLHHQLRLGILGGSGVDGRIHGHRFGVDVHWSLALEHRCDHGGRLHAGGWQWRRYNRRHHRRRGGARYQGGHSRRSLAAVTWQWGEGGQHHGYRRHHRARLLLRPAVATATGNGRIDHQRGLQIPQLLRVDEVLFEFGLKKRSVGDS